MCPDAATLVRDHVGSLGHQAEVHVATPEDYPGLRVVTVSTRQGDPTAYIVDLVFPGVYPVPAPLDPALACARVVLGWGDLAG